MPGIDSAAFASLDPASKAIAVASLQKSGAYSKEQIDAAAKTSPATPAKPTDTSVAGSTVPSQAFVGQRDGMAAVAKIITDHPEMAQAAKDAFKADYGVDYDSLVPTPEQAMYNIPRTPEQYPTDISHNSDVDLDGAAEAQTLQNFNGMLHAIEFPALASQDLVNDMLASAREFTSKSADEVQDYMTGTGLDHSVKSELAYLAGFGHAGWEEAKGSLQEGWHAVWAKISADDKSELLETGALNSARVLFKLAQHGRQLLARQAKS